jgi:hypothetical protein
MCTTTCSIDLLCVRVKAAQTMCVVFSCVCVGGGGGTDRTQPVCKPRRPLLPELKPCPRSGVQQANAAAFAAAVGLKNPTRLARSVLVQGPPRPERNTKATCLAIAVAGCLCVCPHGFRHVAVDARRRRCLHYRRVRLGKGVLCERRLYHVVTRSGGAVARGREHRRSSHVCTNQTRDDGVQLPRRMRPRANPAVYFSGCRTREQSAEVEQCGPAGSHSTAV